MKYLC